MKQTVRPLHNYVDKKLYHHMSLLSLRVYHIKNFFILLHNFRLKLILSRQNGPTVAVAEPNILIFMYN